MLPKSKALKCNTLMLSHVMKLLRILIGTLEKKQVLQILMVGTRSNHLNVIKSHAFNLLRVTKSMGTQVNTHFSFSFFL